MNSKELIQKMEKVVQYNVVAYQTDFYDYDIKTITNMQPYERRFWLVRDTGTYLFTDPDIAKTVMDCDNYIYFAVIYKNHYEYEYTSMNKEDFKKELAIWIDNDLEHIKADLQEGIIYGNIRNDLFIPLLSLNNGNGSDGLVYATDKYGDTTSYGLDNLKSVIYDVMERSPYAVLQMEQRTIDNWYL